MEIRCDSVVTLKQSGGQISDSVALKIQMSECMHAAE